ncbi:hypothetical protein, variant 2 [Aphanomyces astaci]|uniref:BED-type domain-containing protein n=1 Tax=Aphanomyces astaci TaxID=112090 RepID=W4G492_APHAT|nr:hypothetical protein, variant 2 [Aphanomyces astaci]ETV74505.1 hypothetical protein, variant 2 [Aphanomyces astaci]|eukprot:XP_009836163.1 hypothetical protein, variant 2 [Aphanomyces astaci]
MAEATAAAPVERPGRQGTNRTAHIWAHFVKRRDLDKYFNNWRVECRHCRDAYDKRASDDDVSPPEIVISTTVKMMAHLRWCVHARKVIGNDMPPSPVKVVAPKRKSTSSNGHDGSPSGTKKRPTLVKIQPSGEPVAKEASTPATAYSTAYIWEHFIKRTDMAKYYNNWYVECKHCHDAAAAAGTTPPKVFVSAMARMKTHLFKCAHVPADALTAFRKADADMAPLQPRRRAKGPISISSHMVSALAVRTQHPTRANQLFHLALPLEEAIDTTTLEWLTQSSAERPAWFALSKVQATVATSDVLCQVDLVCSQDLYNLPPRSLDKIQAALMSTDQPVASPQSSIPVVDSDATTSFLQAPCKAELAVDKEEDNSMDVENPIQDMHTRKRPWPTVLWTHFIPRAPRLGWYLGVECRHCHVGSSRLDPHSLKQEKEDLLVSSPRRMRRHMQTCRGLFKDEEVADPPPPSPEEDVAGGGLLHREEDPIEALEYAAMEYVVVRNEHDPRGYSLAQLGYDVTASMLHGAEDATVELTMLRM